MKCSLCQREIIRNLKLKEILLPGRMITEELCADCRTGFILLKKEKVCHGCNKPSKNPYCHDCRSWQRQYPDYNFHHEALFKYNEVFKQWMMQYKISGDYRLRYTFQQEIRDFFRFFQREKYLICPLPLSQQRFHKRGFNQVSSFLEAAGVPVTALLVKSLHTKPQAEKNRQDRLQMQQPFELNVEPEEIRGSKIILVDDVYTTGRTMFHGASLLLKHEPKEIRSFSLAR